mgnify:CR=1 FL=1
MADKVFVVKVPGGTFYALEKDLVILTIPLSIPDPRAPGHAAVVGAVPKLMITEAYIAADVKISNIHVLGGAVYYESTPLWWSERVK